MRTNLPTGGSQILFIGILCFAFSVFLLLCCCGQKESGPPKVGDRIPKFTLSDLTGRKITVPDDFQGKVIIIRFWADWCTACSAEMPAIDYLYGKYKAKGLVVLAVNVGQPKDVAKAFVTNLRITYPVLLDTYSVTANRYGVKVVPTMLVVDRNGIVRERMLGESAKETVEKSVLNLL